MRTTTGLAIALLLVGGKARAQQPASARPPDQLLLRGAAPAVAQARPVELGTVAMRRARVMRDLLLFDDDRLADALAQKRDRDRDIYQSGVTPSDTNAGLGAALFAVVTVMSAHAPPSLRILFDERVHLGPAVFDGGGMGAGIGGRFL